MAPIGKGAEQPGLQLRPEGVLTTDPKPEIASVKVCVAAPGAWVGFGIGVGVVVGAVVAVGVVDGVAAVVGELDG